MDLRRTNDKKTMPQQHGAFVHYLDGSHAVIAI